MNVVAKLRFLDSDNNNSRVEPGQPLTMSNERAERLIGLGFVVAGNEDKAKDLKESYVPPVKNGKRK